MHKFMEVALQNAQQSACINEVPVGCVFVYNDEVIAYGANLVNQTKNATRHAELICIDQVLDYCKTHSLSHEEVFRAISVVVTVEPCIMCAAALNNLQVKEIIFGCANDRFGGQTVLDSFSLMSSKIAIQANVRSDEAMQLLKDFYKTENPQAPIPKPKRN